MKKAIVFIILLTVAVALCSCITVNINGTGEQTKEAVTTNGQTTEADTTAAQTEEDTTAAATETEQTEQERVEEFYNTYEGYWSNSEKWDFITFGKENGEYRVTFGIWNAGGPFPSGKVSDVTKTGDKSYLVKINIDAVPSNDENEGWDAYSIEIPITDTSENGIVRISSGYVGETGERTFMYHKEAENPFVGGMG